MPTGKKVSPFYCHAPARSGHYNGKRLFGAAPQDPDKPVTLQDLLDFMATKGLDPKKVLIPSVAFWAQP
jgi:hypothetical protein